MPEGFVSGVAEAGWVRVPGGFERTGPAVDTMLSDGNNTFTTDEQGKFTAPDPANLRTVNVVIDGKPVGALTRSASRSRVTGESIWSVDVPYSCCAHSGSGETTDMGGMKDMEHENHPSRQQAMPGACLDYNGWYSDGVNAPHTSWQGVRNFFMSDCYQAFFVGKCWQDFYPNQSCGSRLGGGYCSAKIGHSASYHKHNRPK